MDRQVGLKILLLGLAVSLLVTGGLGIYFYRSTAAFVGSAARAEGVVVAHEPDASDGDGLVYCVAEFADRDGTAHRVRTSWKSSPPGYDIGEKVEILYDPEDPSDARFVGLALWTGPLICAASAIFDLVAIAAVAVILRHRRAPLAAREQRSHRAGEQERTTKRGDTASDW